MAFSHASELAFREIIRTIQSRAEGWSALCSPRPCRGLTVQLLCNESSQLGVPSSLELQTLSTQSLRVLLETSQSGSITSEHK
jgi:hypothetical protein